MKTIKARRTSELNEIVDLLHDLRFDLDLVQNINGTVTIPFSVPLHDSITLGKRGFLLRPYSIPVVATTLTVGNVISVAIKDTERVGFYDFNIFRFDEKRCRLVIKTGIPLSFEINVGTLEVTLELSDEVVDVVKGYCL